MVPTAIAPVGAVNVARSTTVTEPAPLVTYAFLPSGVMAMPRGSGPTTIGAPAAFVARSIGVTEPPEPLSTT